jgi:hypothetical protein
MSAPAAQALPRLRAAFTVLRLTLGCVLLFQGAHALAGWWSDAGPTPVAVLAGAEVAGAALVLIPRTVRLGGALLVAALLAAAGVHLAHGEPGGALLVHASAAFFVTMHGPVHGPVRP